MKKHTLVIILAYIVSMVTAHAQSDTVRVKIKKISWETGFTWSPQAMWQIGDTNLPKTVSPLFARVSFSTKKLLVIPFYNITSPSVGIFLAAHMEKKLHVLPYIVGFKSIKKTGGYGGVGIAYPIGGTLAFIECGVPIQNSIGKPLLFTGVYIPIGIFPGFSPFKKERREQ